jgi:hypothetical protein
MEEHLGLWDEYFNVGLAQPRGIPAQSQGVECWDAHISNRADPREEPVRPDTGFESVKAFVSTRSGLVGKFKLTL